MGKDQFDEVGLIDQFLCEFTMESLDFRPREMMEVTENRDVWRLNFELLPP